MVNFVPGLTVIEVSQWGVEELLQQLGRISDLKISLNSFRFLSLNFLIQYSYRYFLERILPLEI